MSRLKRNVPDSLLGGLIFVTAFLVFLLSPVHQMTDSRYSMLVSESLLEHGSFALDQYRISRSLPNQQLDCGVDRPYYQLERVDSRLYYFFPPGSSVLSVPFVALMKLCGVSASVSGAYNLSGEMRIQRGLAALLMALLSGVFFFTGRLLLPQGWSVALALAGAFGTQVWSTASRGLWSDTWAILLLGMVVYMLLAREVCGRRINPFVLASLLAWLYFVRPTNALVVVALTVYVMIYGREVLWAYMLTGALWLAGFIIYARYNFGELLPVYYLGRSLLFNQFKVAMAGNLWSPSRGLLIYVPVLLFVFYALVRYWHELKSRGLLILSFSVIILHLIISSGFRPWYGGGCYGPRYSTGLVPWFVLLGILALRAMLDWRQAHATKAEIRGWRATLGVGCLLLALSVWINARGALALETWSWNGQPVTVDAQPGRVWDWRYPQFLAGLLHPPLPYEFPVAERRVSLNTPEADRYLWYGWSGVEPAFRWTDGHEAALIFSLKDVSETSFRMKAAPFLAGSAVAEQNLHLELNGKPLMTLKLNAPEAKVYSIVLPRDALGARNVLRFKLPEAASPAALNLGDDERLLGLSVEWFELVPQATKDQ